MQSRYEQFSASISSIYQSIQKIEKNEMIRYGSRGIYAQYLAALLRYPDGMTAAKLSEICDRDKAAVSRTVADMEKEGLLMRRNQGENKYRALLQLTDEGKRAAQFVARQAQFAVEEGGQGLSDEERLRLQQMLSLIARNLEKLCEEGLPQA